MQIHGPFNVLLVYYDDKIYINAHVNSDNDNIIQNNNNDDDNNNNILMINAPECALHAAFNNK